MGQRYVEAMLGDESPRLLDLPYNEFLRKAKNNNIQIGTDISWQDIILAVLEISGKKGLREVWPGKLFRRPFYSVNSKKEL